MVLVLGGYVGHDIKRLIFTCTSGDVFSEGTVVPSVDVDAGTIKFIKSSKGNNSMFYTVIEGGDTNLLGKGSVIEFICDKDGEWQIYFNIVPESIGSLTTGEISFTSS